MCCQQINFAKSSMINTYQVSNNDDSLALFEFDKHFIAAITSKIVNDLQITQINTTNDDTVASCKLVEFTRKFILNQ